MQQLIIVFLAMVVYVGLNTIRVILVIRGRKGPASLIAATENFIYMSVFAYAIADSNNNILQYLLPQEVMPVVFWPVPLWKKN